MTSHARKQMWSRSIHLMQTATPYQQRITTMKNAIQELARRKERKSLSRATAVAALMSTGMLMPHAVSSAEPVYSVVSPLGDVTVEMIEMGPRLNTLSNKTVCLVSNNAFKVNVTMPAIAKALQERYPGLKIVPYDDLPRAPNVDNMGAMPAAYKSKGCDAVISGNGG
jgi:hypothetical protein